MIIHTIFVLIISCITIAHAFSLQSWYEVSVLLPFVMWYFLRWFHLYMLDDHFSRQTQGSWKHILGLLSFLCLELVVLSLGVYICSYYFSLSFSDLTAFLIFVFGFAGCVLAFFDRARVSTILSRRQTEQIPTIPKKQILLLEKNATQKGIFVYILVLYVIILFAASFLFLGQESLYPLVFFLYPLFLIGFFQSR